MFDINHIAQLARLGLSAQEAEKLQKELSVILDYIDKLNELDTKKAGIMAQTTGLANITREDEIKNCPLERQEKIINLAPKKQNGYFKVKRIL